MSIPERPACTALHEYMRGDDELFDKIRMNFEWDERAFQRLVQVSTRCLEEIEHDDMIPRYVASFFGYWLHIIMSMMEHPDFLKLNREGRTKEDTEAYFNDCIAIMKKLVHWMSSGPCPYPSTDFMLPGWESPTTETTPSTPDITAPAPKLEGRPRQAPERSACVALHDYMRGDGRRFDKPGVTLAWDDEAFRTLVHLAKQCIEEVEGDDMIPRYVAELCGDWLQDLKRTLHDPRFLALHRGDRTEEEAKVYFNARLNIIHSLVTSIPGV